MSSLNWIDFSPFSRIWKLDFLSLKTHLWGVLPPPVWHLDPVQGLLYRLLLSFQHVRQLLRFTAGLHDVLQHKGGMCSRAAQQRLHRPVSCHKTPAKTWPVGSRLKTTGSGSSPSTNGDENTDANVKEHLFCSSYGTSDGPLS